MLRLSSGSCMLRLGFRLSIESCMLRLRLSFRGSGIKHSTLAFKIERQPVSRSICLNRHVSACRVRSDPCRSVSSRIPVKPRLCRAVSSRPCVHSLRAVPSQTAACPRVPVMSAPPCKINYSQADHRTHTRGIAIC